MSLLVTRVSTELEAGVNAIAPSLHEVGEHKFIAPYAGYDFLVTFTTKLEDDELATYALACPVGSPDHPIKRVTELAAAYAWQNHGWTRHLDIGKDGTVRLYIREASESDPE